MRVRQFDLKIPCSFFSFKNGPDKTEKTSFYVTLVPGAALIDLTERVRVQKRPKRKKSESDDELERKLRATAVTLDQIQKMV